MAKKETEQQETPAGPSEETLARHRGILQKSLDSVTAGIVDHPKTSMVRRLVRAHRAGLDTGAMAETAFAAIEEALADARASYAEGIRPKEAAAKVEVPSRVSL